MTGNLTSHRKYKALIYEKSEDGWVHQGRDSYFSHCHVRLVWTPYLKAMPKGTKVKFYFNNLPSLTLKSN